MSTLSGVKGRTITATDEHVEIADKRGQLRTRVPRAALTGIDFRPATWTQEGHLRLVHDRTLPGVSASAEDADTILFTRDKGAAFAGFAQSLGWVDPAAAPPAPALASSGARVAEKPAWYRRRWVPIVAAGVIGIGLGAASAGEPTAPKDSDEYKALSAQFEDQGEELVAAQKDLEGIAGELPQRERDLEAALADMEKRETAVGEAETAVKDREDAVTQVENDIAAGTIEGDGLYEVGVDIEAGVYKTAGSGSNCYYAILNSTDTFDIANNNNVTGPAVVTLAEGKFFESSGCAEWIKQ